jgi:peroxiredoxin
MGDAAGLDVGTPAPDFTAPLVTADGETADVQFSSLYEETPVLLAFYTNDFSPDCVTEWCSFRDYEWFATGEQVQVVGISRSRPYTHRKFIDYLDIDFPLYSDRDLSVSAAYDVRYRAFKLFARPRRSVFLVDGDGVVRYRWVGDHPVDPTRDVPPVSEIHDAVTDVLGEPETETFGFG